MGITDANGELSANSNYSATKVDLAAPGQIIGAGTGYSSWSTPYVTGVVALLQNQNPDWTYTQIIHRILSTVDPLPSLSREDG